jgi:hypothetical protein
MSDYEGNPQPAPEQQQPASDPYASINDMYGPEEAAATRDALQGVIDHHVQAALEPVQRGLEYVTGTLDAQEHEEQLADLEDRYPELRSDAVAEKVLAEARDYAAEVGDPSLATDPQTLELLFLRSRGQAGGRGSQRQQNPTGDDINAQILSVQGSRNVFDQTYGG